MLSGVVSVYVSIVVSVVASFVMSAVVSVFASAVVSTGSVGWERRRARGREGRLTIRMLISGHQWSSVVISGHQRSLWSLGRLTIGMQFGGELLA